MVSSSYMYIRYVSVYMIYVYIVCMCILKFTSWRGYSWYFSYGHLISVSENGEFNYEKMMVWFVFEKLTLYIIIHHHPIGGEHLHWGWKNLISGENALLLSYVEFIRNYSLTIEKFQRSRHVIFTKHPRSVKRVSDFGTVEPRGTVPCRRRVWTTVEKRSWAMRCHFGVGVVPNPEGTYLYPVL